MASQQKRHKSTSDHRYDTYEDEIDDVTREKEWKRYNDTGKTIFKPGDDNNSAFQVKGARTRIRSWELYKIRTGNHVAWHSPLSIYWHHAIVVDTDEDTRQLLVIHYTKKDGQIQIYKEWIKVEDQWGELFLFDYSSDILQKNSTHTVMKRAHALLKRESYGLSKNNCEHFATYCKTGIKDSTQVRWASGKFFVTTLTTAAKEVAKAVGNQSYSSMATSGGKVIAAEGIESAGKASNWLGAALVVGFETLHCAYDIYHLRKVKNERKMTQRDYNVTVTQRVSEGVFGSAGAAADAYVGGIIGGWLGSCVPVVGTAVGTFVGSAVGGAVGSIVGKAIGSIFGGWLGRTFW